MSKGINIFNHFTPPVSDGHKIVAFEIEGPRIYCPITKTVVTGKHTSNGPMCTCEKFV